jgi:hypothetical protein
MSRNLFFSCLLILHGSMSEVCAQGDILEYAGEMELKSGWQEYMPDAYVLDDSTWVTVGMNVNMVNLTVNVFFRWLSDQGEVLKEVELFHMNNPDTASWLLSDFYNGSAMDDEFIYVLADITDYPCQDTGSMVRSCRIMKVGRYDGHLERDTVLCLDSVRVFRGIQTSSLEDSIYLFSSVGYVNVNPKTHFSTMPKSLNSFTDYAIKGRRTTLQALNIAGDSRMVAGSENAYYPTDDKKKDIWYGRIEGDTIIKKISLNYFELHFLHRTRILDENEIAILGKGDFGTVYTESSVLLMDHDSLQWNFYDTYYQFVEDVVKIGNKYCVVQVDFRGFDYRKIKIILHFIDPAGIPYSKKEFTMPWLEEWDSLFGQRIGDNYFISGYIANSDAIQAYLDGETSLTDTHWDYTKILKFKLHE